jgi:Fe-S oxidoreductase
MQLAAIIVSLVLAAVGVALFCRAIAQIYRYVRLGQPVPAGTRTDDPKQRTLTVAREFLGHTRMARWGVIGVAHWFVAVGFFTLVLTLVNAFGQLFEADWVLPIIGHWAPYEAFTEFIGIMTTLGILTLIIIRQLSLPSRPGRKSRFAGSNLGQAYFVEAVILIIGLAILLLRGLEGALAGVDGYRAAYFVSYPLARAFDGLDVTTLQNLIYLVAMIKIATSFIWMIAVALKTDMGVAWHRFLAFPNIWFKRESGGGVALGALQPMVSQGKPIDFEDPGEDEQFGVSQVEHFSWKGLLDFSTCTECGRCQSQCPAWNTGKPLSPKLLIMGLRDHAHAKAPYRLAGGGKTAEGTEKAGEEQLRDVPASALAEAERPLIGTLEENGVIDPDVLWSCTTCGACVEQCPVDIEHVDHIVDMRRYQVMIESSFPSEAGTMLKNLERRGNPWGLAKKQRLAWTKELQKDTGIEIPVVGKDIEDLTEVDYLYWVGCAGALEDRAKKTTKAFAELLHIAGVKFAIMGGDEACTGDSARRLGNEFLFQQLGQQNVEMLNMAFGEDPDDTEAAEGADGAGEDGRDTAAASPSASAEAGQTAGRTGNPPKRIVATCPHCFNTLANEYPQLGGHYEVIHHTQLLQHLVDEGRLVPVTPVEGLITYHDPCYLGRHNKVYTPPREIIAKVPGLRNEEMHRHKERGFCCGAGGARMWMEERIGKRINSERVDEALSLNPDIVSTACPFCLVMLSDSVNAKVNEGKADESLRVVDVAQLLLEAVQIPAGSADDAPADDAQADEGPGDEGPGDEGPGDEGGPAGSGRDGGPTSDGPENDGPGGNGSGGNGPKNDGPEGGSPPAKKPEPEPAK